MSNNTQNILGQLDAIEKLTEIQEIKLLLPIIRELITDRQPTIGFKASEQSDE